MARDGQINVKNILFRADSSLKIGTGHIMRDLVLASKYSNDNIIFAVQNEQGNINYKIEENNYQVVILNSNSFKETDRVIKNLDIELIVIDHYGIDFEFEKQLKIHNPDITVMVLDDTYEKHHCDILLNHNIYAEVERYNNLVPKGCILQCGEKYTLLRNEFIVEKKTAYFKKKETNNIFIAMGGIDIACLNIEILKRLSEFKNININLMTTSSNPNIEALKRYVNAKKWVTLHIDSLQMAKLLSQSDLAIITPSVTLNEVWYMETPFIAIQVADNQCYMTQFLLAKNKDVLVKFNPRVLSKKLVKVLAHGI